MERSGLRRFGLILADPTREQLISGKFNYWQYDVKHSIVFYTDGRVRKIETPEEIPVAWEKVPINLIVGFKPDGKAQFVSFLMPLQTIPLINTQTFSVTRLITRERKYSAFTNATRTGLSLLVKEYNFWS